MRISGIVVQGHQVASGENKDPKFPGGTLAMQLPCFRERGLDLSDWHLATLNVQIAPLDFQIIQPDWHFEDVDWHPSDPPEDFSFVSVQVFSDGRKEAVDGLIYYPHPETKPGHFQPPGVMEILLKEYISGVEYGSSIEVEVSDDRVLVTGVA